MKHLGVKFKIKKTKKCRKYKRKLLNINLAKSYGWKPKIAFEEGLDLTIKDFKKILSNYEIINNCSML